MAKGDSTRVQLNAARTAVEKAAVDKLSKASARDTQIAETARSRGNGNHPGRS